MEFAQGYPQLIEVMHLSDAQKALLRTRYVPLLIHAAKETNSAAFYDMFWFLVGFIGLMLVTTLTAVSKFGYIGDSLSDALTTSVLVLSSVSTAAVGLRERFKFNELAGIMRQYASRLERRGVLFAGNAGSYANDPLDESFRKFIADVEKLKLHKDDTVTMLSDEDAELDPSKPVFPGTLSDARRTPQAPSNTPVTVAEVGIEVPTPPNGPM